MRIRSSLALALVVSCVIPVVAQNQPPTPSATPTPSPQQGQKDEDDVVRITTNLVQVDAVVTGKDGKQVTDLRPEEVEIYEDGKLQKITNFSFIGSDVATSPKPAAQPGPVDKNAPPVPPVRLRPEQVRRTVALIVDDLGLSFESTAYVRSALKKFVDQQMQPGDLVAIIRTAGGMGALQQFTSDKRQLYAAIERVKWNPQGRGGIAAFAPLEGNPLAQAEAASGPLGASVDTGSGEDVDQFRESLLTVGTLGALRYVVRGMQELPGRKSILLVSDGIKIFNADDPTRSSRVLDALHNLTDLANRASVVIYTMDARGLQTLGLTAADSTTGFSAEQVEDQLSSRRAEYFESQNGLNYLARQTGGFPIFNNNDLIGGIKRVLEDQRGYYLIGYRPDDSTFDKVKGRTRFHKILIKVNRPGARVRSRTGFFGITDQQAAPAPRTPAEQLISALTSPFASGGIKLRLTSLYGNDQKAGSFLRSLLHIDARDLTFTDEPEGWHKAIIDVVAITFGDNGMIVDQLNRTHTIRLRGETYKQALENGFVYILTFPVKKPGAYQLRTAIRDSTSEHVGSAAQFIEVPNIGKNRLTLSGIVVSGTNATKPALNESGSQPQPSAGGPRQPSQDELEKSDPLAGPAVRRFKPGMIMQYAYVIYNATLDKATGHAQVQTQLRLFRDGKQVFIGRSQPLESQGQADYKRLAAGGALHLGTELIPGEYILQVVATDPAGKEKYRIATQWIDFEIVK